MLALLGPIGTPELIVILFVAILIFGNRLPSVIRSLGSSVNEFKRGLHETEAAVATAPAEHHHPAPVKELP